MSKDVIHIVISALICLTMVACNSKPTAQPGAEAGWKAPQETNMSPSVTNLTRKNFVGSWRNAAGKTTFVLHEDGSAETFMGVAKRYPGTWQFSSPRSLLVRAVVPLNDPRIDDELNALEMYFRIRKFTGDSFTAEEFDYEDLREFSKVGSDTR